MLKLARWCIAHRRSVFVAWVAIAVLTTLIAGAVGRDYSTNFSLPGTDTQRAYNLINRDFAAASGDNDQIVFHIAAGRSTRLPCAPRSPRCCAASAAIHTSCA